MRQQGFTLIEALIVVLLIGLGMIVLTTMFFSQIRLYRTQSSELNVTSSVRLSLDDIDNYVRQANHTLASYSTYTAGPQVLILQIQSMNSSNLLIPGVYDYVVYEFSGTSLVRTIFADATSTRVSGSKTLASNVASAAFSYNNADFAQVSQVATTLTCTESAGYQSRSYSGNSISKLRDF